MRESKLVEISLMDVVGEDFETFLDNLLDLCGEPLGMDVHYELVGVNTLHDTLFFQVEYDIPDNDEEDE